ncbi:glycoside hydrolase family 13 protein [Clostridium tarantellae]|uniref:Alpha,alpha-phosphotrehalase n=1 Tax=Clostridium tarantellae TaxID=39493 RepID=A0A6I1MLY1_9CLOT|nr:alpha-glucosidase [Clostridium tarantellae]MPQ44014.1 alpha,alpha-phosphotrehalase [Clostridium tarantellae]
MKEKWWKEAVGYQIYPRSFKDSNGDGIGDLNGIIAKLDYIKDLGIDVIWICPMYKSPNDDNGYDISDYKDIMYEFGTMDDFNNLLKEIHKREMKLIIDLVINHTSDEHPWFIESKSSKDSAKRDWYIWKKGKEGEEGEEPNNWESIFGGSVWEYDEKTKEYFLHLFTKRQPDLNWENKEVREALYEMINWWLDKGVDGFRVDAISHIKKEKDFKDISNSKGKKYVSSFDKHMNVEGIHTFLEELNNKTFKNYDIMTVGEANGVKANEGELWVGEEKGKFNMIFQFDHLDLWDYESEKKLDVVALKKVLSQWQYGLHNLGWNALFIENHDIPRVVSKWGNDKEYWKESSKALALMYFMQQGTPFIYQGQEIGMTNIKFPSIHYYNDVKTINMYNEKILQGISEEKALNYIWNSSRDNTRTPMQWDNSKNAGFTEGEPWMLINENSSDINVKSQLEDENSILSFYKNLIKIRKENKTLVYGKYELLEEKHEQIYAYKRIYNGEEFLILCNLSNEEAKFNSKLELNSKNILISNYKVSDHYNTKNITLKPYEARLYII